MRTQCRHRACSDRPLEKSRAPLSAKHAPGHMLQLKLVTRDVYRERGLCRLHRTCGRAPDLSSTPSMGASQHEVGRHNLLLAPNWIYSHSRRRRGWWVGMLQLKLVTRDVYRERGLRRLHRTCGCAPCAFRLNLISILFSTAHFAAQLRKMAVHCQTI